MLTIHKRLSDYVRGMRIIYIIPKPSNVSEKQNRLIKQINLINLNRIIRIIEDVLAATSIFAIAYLWLLVARGFGWH